jgi:hypothetical protein
MLSSQNLSHFILPKITKLLNELFLSLSSLIPIIIKYRDVFNFRRSFFLLSYKKKKKIFSKNINLIFFKKKKKKYL